MVIEGGGPGMVLYGDMYGRTATFGQRSQYLIIRLSSTTRHQASDDALASRSIAYWNVIEVRTEILLSILLITDLGWYFKQFCLVDCPPAMKDTRRNLRCPAHDPAVVSPRAIITIIADLDYGGGREGIAPITLCEDIGIRALCNVIDE